MSTAVSNFWLGEHRQSTGQSADDQLVTQHVTAVIVAHDGAQWLPRVLDSLAAASRKPDSLIAVDTGSTDESQKLLKRSELVDHVVDARARAGFGEAVQMGLRSGNPVLDLTEPNSGDADVVEKSDEGDSGEGDANAEIDLRDAESESDRDVDAMLHACYGAAEDGQGPNLEAARKDLGVSKYVLNGWRKRGNCPPVTKRAGSRRNAAAFDRLIDAAAELLETSDGSSNAAKGEDTLDLSSDAAAEPQDSSSVTTEQWIWLLHDDCSVAPDALSELLACAAANPDASVVGPKTHRWDEPEILLECGVSYTAFGRRITGIEGRELDQGQYDHRLDVFAVSSAGMLVRREVWERLAGFTAAMPIFGDDHDFCYRVQMTGGRVVVATKAVVFHREAAASDQRKIAAGPRSAMRSQRRAANLNALAQAPLWRLPFSMLRLVITGLVGSILALAGLTAGSVWDQFASTFGPVCNLKALWRVRRKVSKTASLSRRELHRKRDSIGRDGSYWQEAVPRFLDHGSHSSMQSIRERGQVLANWSMAVMLPMLAISFVATRALWFGAGQVHGGALLPAPDGIGPMWAGFVGSWHEVGLGSDVASPPFLAVLSLLAVLFVGSTTAAVQVLLLLAPLFAATSAFVSLRGFATGLPRVAGSLAYGLVPAAVAAVGTGRLATVVVAIMLPLVARGLARVSGIARGALPEAHWPLVAGVGLGVAVVAAFSPPSAILLLGLAAIWSISGSGRAKNLVRVVAVALAPAVLLWPWSGYLFANPGLLLLDTGATNTALSAEAAMPWQLAILDPGGLAAPPTGFGAFLVVLAIAATFNKRIRKLAAIAWSAVLAALMLGTWQAVSPVSVPWSATDEFAWPGSATLVLAAAFVLLVVAAATHPPDAKNGKPVVDDDDELGASSDELAFRRSRGVVGPSLALAGALVIAGWWVVEQQPLVGRSDAAAVSPFVAATAQGPEAPRTLLMSRVGRGAYEYLLVSGAGPVLGDAELAPSAESMAEIDQAVSRLASGGNGADVQTLADASVRYVQAHARDDRELARQLDAVAGLSRISTADGQALWEVQGWKPRARITQEDGKIIPVPVGLTDGGSLVVDTEVDAATGLGTFTLAESANELWRAAAGGAQLQSVAGEGLQTFVAQDPATGPVALTASADEERRMMSLIVPAIGLGIILLVGLTRLRKRRRHGKGTNSPQPNGSSTADRAQETDGLKETDGPKDDTTSEVSA